MMILVGNQLLDYEYKLILSVSIIVRKIQNTSKLQTIFSHMCNSFTDSEGYTFSIQYTCIELERHTFFFIFILVTQKEPNFFWQIMVSHFQLLISKAIDKKISPYC